ncbi:hypothetical protein ACFRKE_01105 [Kitasatospora indigofera]
MDQNAASATITTIEQRGRLIIPAALQRDAGITPGNPNGDPSR